MENSDLLLVIIDKEKMMVTRLNKVVYGIQTNELMRRLWGTSRTLTLLGFASLGLALLSAILIVLDPRLITAAPAWAKPAKFGISTVFYALTLTWMLSYVKGHPRLVGLVSGGTVVGMVVELALIVLQVVRGVRSHFNHTTPLDSAVFSVMGVFIVIVWTMNLIAAVLLMHQKLSDRAFAWSLRLGLLITLVGAGVAFLMIRPNPAQEAALNSGKMPAVIGAHSVGVEDGGAGLPFVGWSTEGGDLRIPHFFGLHALQALPLAGYVINRIYKNQLSQRRRTALVWAAGLGYLGLVLLLTWQALRGQSIIAPDLLTTAAFGALGAAVIASAAAIVRVGWPYTSTQERSLMEENVL